MKNEYTMSNFQLFALITGAIVANGIMTLPRAVATHAGRDAWIVVFLTGLLMTAASALLHKLASWYPNHDPGQWATMLLGPVIGRVWLILLVTKTFMFSYLTAKLYAGVLSVRILIYTPTYVIAIAIIALALLINQTSIRSLARYSELVFIGKASLLALLIVPSFLSKNHHVYPVLIETPITSVLDAIPAAAFSYVGFEILWFAYPYLKNKSVVIPVAAMSYVTLSYTATTLSATLFFGPERLQSLLLPTLSMLSILTTPVLERVDSLFLWLWVGTVSVTAATQFYIGIKALQGLYSRLDFKKTSAFYGGVLFAVAVSAVPLPNLYEWADRLGIFDVIIVIGGALIFLPLAYVKSVLEGGRRG